MKLGSKPSLVLLNGKSPLSSGGGYQTYTYILGTILKALGYDVTIFSFGEKSAEEQSSAGKIVTVNSRIYRLPFLRTTESGGLAILAPLLAFAVLRNHDFNKPTLLLGIGPWSLTGALIKLLMPKKNVRLISYYPTTFRHEYFGTLCAMSAKDYGILSKMKAWFIFHTLIPFYSLLEKFSVDTSDKIINHYQSAERILLEQFNIKSSKFIMLPYYIDIVKRTSYTTHQQSRKYRRPLILLICRHDGRKGINFLLHAFAILNRRKIKYSAVLIGGGKLLKVHKLLAVKLRLSNINFMGFVGDLSGFLKNADIFVFPSVEEGSSSISILEAMKYGLPIISTNVDGIPEDIENEKSGLLVEPFDPLSLANAMERVLKNPALRKRLGVEARKRYSKRNNLAIVKKKLDEALKKIIREYRL